MIFTALLAGVEQALNRVLRLDPEVAAELFKLQGKVIRFHFRDIDRSVFVKVYPEHLALADIFDGQADAILSGSTLTFLHTYSQGFSVGNGLSISGQLEVAQSFSEQMQRFRIDWEELLSRVMGDIAAHKVHTTISDFFSWGADSLERLRMDTAEYVHEEAQITPSAAELEDFIHEVALVRDGVERAQARVDRLLKEQGGSSA